MTEQWPPYDIGLSQLTCLNWQMNSGAYLRFLARDAFVRTNRHAIAIIFVRLSVWDARALWS